MKQSGKFLKLTVMGGLVLSFALGCGENSSETDDDSDTTTRETDNALAAAFPGSLALTIFPTEASTSLHDNAGLPLTQDDNLSKDAAFDPNAKSLQDKVAEQEKIAAGTADSCIPPALAAQLAAGPEESCYEFDQDMIYGTNDTSAASPSWLGTQNGKAANSEACLVAFTRSQVSQVLAMLDQTLGFGMAAICQHKKLNPDVKLPAIGASIDLAPALTDLFADKITVTSATIERLDDANDNPVYRILIKAKMGMDDIQRTVGIIHSPQDDDNSEYSGTIYTILEGIPDFVGASQNSPSGQEATTKYQLLSITYQRSSGNDSKKIKAELRSAQIAEDLVANAITSSGVLDLNVGTNVATSSLGSAGYGEYTGYAQSNSAIDGITFVAFDLDVDTSEGSLAYWKNPGGNYYENARGFNIAITKDESSGVLEGCATSGAASTDFSQGISIRRYLNALEADNNLTLSPKGFWHPFMNTPDASASDDKGSYHTKTQQSGQSSKWYVSDISDTAQAATFASQQEGSLITRQCFTRNETSGLYEIDTSAITTNAGYELLDTSSSVEAAKFIPLPEGVEPPADNVVE